MQPLAQGVDRAAQRFQFRVAGQIVEQGAQGTSYGAWLADEIQRRCFDWLDQPVQRVTGAEASPSISKVLERAAAARTEEVVAGLKQAMREQGLG